VTARPEPGTHTFTRESLTDALTRLELRVMLTGPIAGMINAESMADAIIEALGQAGDGRQGSGQDEQPGRE
jgi:hypothetical protein